MNAERIQIEVLVKQRILRIHKALKTYSLNLMGLQYGIIVISNKKVGLLNEIY